MVKKYELVKDDSIECEGHKLYRIRALKDFSDVKKGDLGGYVESEINLNQDGNCWVYDNAKVYDEAKISADAWVSDNAVVCGDAKAHENATVYDKDEIKDTTKFTMNTKMYKEFTQLISNKSLDLQDMLELVYNIDTFLNQSEKN